VRRPGPVTYYSHFSSLYLSTCLAFQTLQVFRQMSRQNLPAKRWYSFFANGYLIILTVCGLIDGIAFCFTPKPDTVAISFFTFLDGIVAITNNYLVNKVEPADSPSFPETGSRIIKPESRFRRRGYVALRVSNRILMAIHVVLVAITVAGAVELALTYSYTNPYVYYLYKYN
jgi:hypothetical protein